MFERFTESSRQAVVLAREEARAMRHGAIGTGHLLLGLVREGEGPAARVPAECGVSLEGVRACVEAEKPRRAPTRTRYGSACWKRWGAGSRPATRRR
ncbi:Clp protease N-terminal domain-containing protein [Nonomuraea sp. NPDC003214]